MWLLSTDRAELHFFNDLCQVQRDGGYAILSHVWDATEWSFQDMQNLAKRCEADGTIPRDQTSAKIRESCIIAERHGYKWIWNDTCCIDKSSSSELSEAINSMYRYYSCAAVCYAYLVDVPTGSRDELGKDRSEFRNSKWHRRGWTLQELIAPEFLIFLSKEWEQLGAKADLADILEEITRVPAPVLRMEIPVSNVSVACRFSWAAGRETTLVEDEAYCLMGIFHIHMPLIYGERENAFQRLQKKIMKSSTDTSLFAWEGGGGGGGLRGARPLFDDSDHHSPTDCIHLHDTPSACLFARSPADFDGCSGVVFDSSTTAPKNGKTIKYTSSRRGGRSALRKRGSRASPPPTIPAFSVTAFGCRTKMQVVELDRITIGVLRCSLDEHGAQEARHTLALLLTPCLYTDDPKRPTYHVGAWDPTCSILRRTVLVEVRGSSVVLGDRKVVPRRKKIFITHRPPPGLASPVRFHIPSNNAMSPPFRVPLETIEHELEDWTLEQLTPTESSWTGEPPMMLVFQYSGKGAEFLLKKPWLTVVLGLCSEAADAGSGSSSPGSHWAEILIFDAGKMISGALTHAISHKGNHIRSWADQRRTRTYGSHSPGLFAGEQADFMVSVTMSFTPCPKSPGSTLVLHLK